MAAWLPRHVRSQASKRTCRAVLRRRGWRRTPPLAIDNAQRNKDAARDGKTGTGRTDMLAGDGSFANAVRLNMLVPHWQHIPKMSPLVGVRGMYDTAFPTGGRGDLHRRQKSSPRPQGRFRPCLRALRNDAKTLPRIRVGRRWSMASSPDRIQFRTELRCTPSTEATSSTV